MSLGAAVIVGRAIGVGQRHGGRRHGAAGRGRRRMRKTTKMSMALISWTFMYVRAVSVVPPPGVRATHGVQTS